MHLGGAGFHKGSTPSPRRVPRRFHSTAFTFGTSQRTLGTLGLFFADAPPTPQPPAGAELAGPERWAPPSPLVHAARRRLDATGTQYETSAQSTE
eukprot:4978466-Prymnesium_polylepis.1